MNRTVLYFDTKEQATKYKKLVQNTLFDKNLTATIRYHRIGVRKCKNWKGYGLYIVFFSFGDRVSLNSLLRVYPRSCKLSCGDIQRDLLNNWKNEILP